jgi:hypothetical protein
VVGTFPRIVADPTDHFKFVSAKPFGKKPGPMTLLVTPAGFDTCARLFSVAGKMRNCSGLEKNLRFYCVLEHFVLKD